MLFISAFIIYNNLKLAVIFFAFIDKEILNRKKILSLKSILKHFTEWQCEVLKTSAESAGGKLSLKDTKAA